MNNLKLALFGALISCVNSSIRAQYWEPVGLGCPAGTRFATMFADSLTDGLIAVGSFSNILDVDSTISCNGMAKWNGNEWESFAPSIPFAGGGWDGDAPMSALFRWKGDLYANGPWNFNQTIGPPDDLGLYRYYARLDTVLDHWIGLGCPNPNWFTPMNFVTKYPEGEDSLFATGHVGSLCQGSSNVFVFDGEEFTPWVPFEQVPYYENTYVGRMFTFQGYTYVSGVFRDPITTQMTSLMRVSPDGVWEHVPGIPVVNDVLITDYMVHDNTLYISGPFHMASGAPGNLVASFDGTTWNNLGGGLSGPIWVWDLLWWQDKLYACGSFNGAGGVWVDRIAYWNGWHWCGLPGDLESVAPLELNRMCVWQDSLYVIGNFDSADGQPAYGIAKWIGGDAVNLCSDPVAVYDIERVSPVRVSPNPCENFATVTGVVRCAGEILLVSDLSGRTILSQRLQSDADIRLDLSSLSSGVYVLSIRTDREVHSAKVIKR